MWQVDRGNDTHQLYLFDVPTLESCEWRHIMQETRTGTHLTQGILSQSHKTWVRFRFATSNALVVLRNDSWFRGVDLTQVTALTPQSIRGYPAKICTISSV